MNKTTPVRSAFETPADSTVEDILRDSERKQAEAGLSQDERRQVIERRRRQQEKREKAQRKAQAQLPNRINLNLPLDLKASLESIAKWNRSHCLAGGHLPALRGGRPGAERADQPGEVQGAVRKPAL